mmetsp:Transcript_16272/g.21295  ORF Transcript_16272/g.21295 Transcript_16272/m.21295 type:complete len:138 (+) Transcript_16272:41-454(+)
MIRLITRPSATSTRKRLSCRLFFQAKRQSLLGLVLMFVTAYYAEIAILSTLSSVAIALFRFHHEKTIELHQQMVELKTRSAKTSSSYQELINEGGDGESWIRSGEMDLETKSLTEKFQLDRFKHLLILPSPKLEADK